MEIHDAFRASWAAHRSAYRLGGCEHGRVEVKIVCGYIGPGEDLYVQEYLHTVIEDRRAWVPRIRKVSPDGKAAIIATVRRLPAKDRSRRQNRP